MEFKRLLGRCCLVCSGLCVQGSSRAVFAALRKGTFTEKPMVSHFRGARAKCWRAEQPLTTSHNSPQRTPAQVREECGKSLPPLQVPASQHSTRLTKGWHPLVMAPEQDTPCAQLLPQLPLPTTSNRRTELYQLIQFVLVCMCSYTLICVCVCVDMGVCTRTRRGQK